MNLVVYLFLAVATAGAVFLLVRAAVGLYSYLHFRGTRLVTCPETKRPAAVEIDAGYLGLTSALGMAPRLRLEELLPLAGARKVRRALPEPAPERASGVPGRSEERRVGKECRL